MKKIVPDEIVTILHKLEKKSKLANDEKTKLDSFLESLETAIVNPACKSKILVNPLPAEPDISLQNEENLEMRIRRINSVNARIQALNQPETEEEANDFNVGDDFDNRPIGMFEVVDHFLPMVEEELSPNDPSLQEINNPDISSVSEADVSTSPPPEGSEQ